MIRALPVLLDAPLSPALLSALATFRRLTNEILREANSTQKTSRAALSRFARCRAFDLQLTGTHALVASRIALSLLKAHRTRLRRGRSSTLPYVTRPFLRADDSTLHFDLERARVRLSLSNGRWDSFGLRVAEHHRNVLTKAGVHLKQLHLTATRAVFFYEKPVPEPYNPTSLIALDSNERSLDGVVVAPSGTQPAIVRFPEIATVQNRHFIRRRRLDQKKATDRRVGRRLLAREGQRERHRVSSRLHVLTKRLVQVAAGHSAAIALEDFRRLQDFGARPRRAARWTCRGAPRSPRLRRRLSSWPRGELHRQLAYKAAERGVPILWVDPYRTSTTCPRCGQYNGARSRMGTTFHCWSCGWMLDRQLNAGVNVARTALRATAELGGLWLDLDALSNEARRPRYPFRSARGARAERREREG